MSTVPQPEYYLLWKGRQSGPFPLAVIREKLTSGEINRMHQVGVGGKWTVLGEFLEQQDGGPIEARRRAEAARQQAEEARRQAEAAQREEQLRREYDAQLAAERAQHGVLERRLADAEKRSSLSHLLPPPPPADVAPAYPPPPYMPVEAYPPPPGYIPPGYPDPFAAPYPPSAPARTSSLAIIAFIMALGNFVPFLDFVTWVMAIVFGHMALSQIKQDPTLGGRGLALAALIITYVLLGLLAIGWFVYGFTHGFNASSLPHL